MVISRTFHNWVSKYQNDITWKVTHANHKLYLLYLTDSIVKNVGGNYNKLFQDKLVANFEEAFRVATVSSFFLTPVRRTATIWLQIDSFLIFVFTILNNRKIWTLCKFIFYLLEIMNDLKFSPFPQASVGARAPRRKRARFKPFCPASFLKFQFD